MEPLRLMSTMECRCVVSSHDPRLFIIARSDKVMSTSCPTRKRRGETVTEHAL